MRSDDFTSWTRTNHAASIATGIVAMPHSANSSPIVRPRSRSTAATTAPTVIASALMMLLEAMTRARRSGSLSCCSTA